MIYTFLTPGGTIVKVYTLLLKDGTAKAFVRLGGDR